ARRSRNQQRRDSPAHAPQAPPGPLIGRVVRRSVPVAFISNADCGRHDTGWGHPEHVGRLRAIPRALRERPELFHALVHVEGRHATRSELALAHDAQYVDRVQAIVADGGGRLDPDTVVSAGSWDAATAGAGCVLDAV